MRPFVRASALVLMLLATASCTSILGDYTATPAEDCLESQRHISECIGQPFQVFCEKLTPCLADCIVNGECNDIRATFMDMNANTAVNVCAAGCPGAKAAAGNGM